MENTLEHLDRVLERLSRHGTIETLGQISHHGGAYPIHQLSLGSSDPNALQLAFVGGVHGLERIGSEVLISYLHTISELLDWDEQFQERLRKSRLLFIPILNPVGVRFFTRSNGRGVDLMRNGSLMAEPLKGPIYRGHQISKKLPWYRGREDGEMEPESQILFETIQKNLFQAPLSMVIDVHSGFGAKDRLWFPFGHRHVPFPNLPETYRLKLLLDKTYPYHVYEVEPVSCQYTIHGDLWDELYLISREKGAGTFIPFTLEMGSWNWLRKNPLQIFQRLGVFHPLKPHRQNRILRRHVQLFDFFHRGLLSWQKWWPKTDGEREQLRLQAERQWYKGAKGS